MHLDVLAHQVCEAAALRSGDCPRDAAADAVAVYLRAGGLQDEQWIEAEAERIVDLVGGRLGDTESSKHQLRAESLREAMTRLSSSLMQRDDGPGSDRRARGDAAWPIHAVLAPAPRAVPRDMPAQPTPQLTPCLRASKWLISAGWMRPRVAPHWQTAELE